MTFNPERWHPIAVVLSAINVAALGFAVGAAEPWHAAAHGVFALAFGLWARHLRQGSGGRDLSQIEDQLEQQAVALEDTQAALADQLRQLTELQERVDFAERLLTQARDRHVLGQREERG